MKGQPLKLTKRSLPMAQSKSTDVFHERRAVSIKPAFLMNGQPKQLKSKTSTRRRSGSEYSHDYRISKKRVDHPPKRSAKPLHPIVQNLTDVFDYSRNSVRDETNEKLNKTVEELNEKLSQVLLGSENDLGICEALREAVAKPFKEEWLQLTTNNDDGTKLVQAVPFLDRIQEHRAVMKTISKETMSLWEGWKETREKITCLGVEILGLGAFDLRSWNGHIDFQNRLAESAQVFEKEQAFASKIQSSGHGLEQEVNSFINTSIKRMNSSAEAWQRGTTALEERFGDACDAFAKAFAKEGASSQ